MRTIVVTTGSRLHFGLIIGGEPHALQFSGIGTMIDSPGWSIRVSHAEGAGHEFVYGADVAEDDRVPMQACVDAIRSRFVKSLRVSVEENVPRHVGLGSGTQFAYALDVAIHALVQRTGRLRYEEQFERNQVRRGKRSKVGRLGFLSGGFIYDGLDDGADVTIPFPPDWRWILVWPRHSKGTHGKHEQQVFDEITPMPPALTERLTQRIEARILPAVRSRQFSEFASALGKYGREVGAFYADHQGDVMADPGMLSLADRLAKEGVCGAAQSSWGPAIAIPAESEASAHAISDRIMKMPGADGWEVRISRPRTEGFHLQTLLESPG